MSNKVCLTGAGWTTRAEIVKLLEEHGNQVVNSVTKDTNMLVQANPDSDTSKSRKAKEYNISIWSYDDLRISLGV
jgi:NAD-dependent DNA ligase